MKRTTIILVSLMLAMGGLAQQPNHLGDGALLDGKTLIKTSVSSLLLRTGAFSAERIISKNVSIGVSASFMPSGALPHANTILDIAGTDAETREMITGVQLNTFSFSPEVRIYFGRGYGRGFYLSPYYRYERYGLENLSLEFTFQGFTDAIPFEGDFRTHSAGLMLGYQWLLGKNKNIVIDLTFLGAHYGASSGSLNGRYETDFQLTDQQRQQAQESLNESLSNLPFIEAEGTLHSDNSADVSISGPWVFPRGSLSVGIRF